MKVYNFSAGPAKLPEKVLEIAQSEFCNYRDCGSSVMELSHRGKVYQPIIDAAVANIRELMNVSDDYEVLFVQGGASMQFCMLAMNLLNGGIGDYADTGVWSAKAAKEGKNFGTVNLVCSSKETKYDHIPTFSEWKMTPGAQYLHITSNNTVAGTEYAAFPKPLSGVPMIADMSSDIMGRVVNVNDFGLIYAGAQKNLGPAGFALVIIRKDLMARVKENVPTMLKYTTYAENGSMFNTPPTYGIYILKLVTDYFKEMGGIAAIEKINRAKAAKLYSFIEASSFYRSPVAKDSRSIMNIVFRTPSEEQDAAFVKAAEANGLTSLKGHRLVGGLRASLYNAMPMEGVDALISFMKDFEQKA